MTRITAYAELDEPATLPELLDDLEAAQAVLDALATHVDAHRQRAADDDERADLEHLRDLLAEAWAKAATAGVVLVTMRDVNDALTAARDQRELAGRLAATCTNTVAPCALPAACVAPCESHAASCPQGCTGCWCSSAGACWHHR